jgi:hypothetical protein
VSVQPLARLLAPRVPKVFETLVKGGRFPDADGDWSLAGGESVPHWFRRVVDTLPGKLRAAEVDRGLALFFIVDQQGTGIQRASLTAVVTPHTPIGELLKATPKHMYLRADFHPGELGKPFREPLPHIHLAGDKEPRVKLDSMETGNLVADFVDFLYRTWFPDAWESWSREVWRRWRAAHGMEGPDPYNVIKKAYNEGKAELLRRQFASELAHMKAAWRWAKDATYPGRLDTELCSLISIG